MNCIRYYFVLILKRVSLTLSSLETAIWSLTSTSTRFWHKLLPSPCSCFVVVVLLVIKVGHWDQWEGEWDWNHAREEWKRFLKRWWCCCSYSVIFEGESVDQVFGYAVLDFVFAFDFFFFAPDLLKLVKLSSLAFSSSPWTTVGYSTNLPTKKQEERLEVWVVDFASLVSQSGMRSPLEKSVLRRSSQLIYLLKETRQVGLLCILKEDNRDTKTGTTTSVLSMRIKRNQIQAHFHLHIDRLLVCKVTTSSPMQRAYQTNDVTEGLPLPVISCLQSRSLICSLWCTQDKEKRECHDRNNCCLCASTTTVIESFVWLEIQRETHGHSVAFNSLVNRLGHAVMPYASRCLTFISKLLFIWESSTDNL